MMGEDQFSFSHNRHPSLVNQLESMFSGDLNRSALYIAHYAVHYVPLLEHHGCQVLQQGHGQVHHDEHVLPTLNIDSSCLMDLSLSCNWLIFSFSSSMICVLLCPTLLSEESIKQCYVLII